VSEAFFILNLVSAVVLTLGVVIGLTQLRQHTRQRRHDAMVELVRSFQTAEMAQALSFVTSLESLAADEVTRRLEEDLPAPVAYLLIAFESLGVLVHREEVDIELVRQLSGGPVTRTWRVLQPWAERQRMQLGWTRLCEWYQWLAEQLEEREGQAKGAPAHQAFRDWRPRSKW
jgi:hypothetical protein